MTRHPVTVFAQCLAVATMLAVGEAHAEETTGAAAPPADPADLFPGWSRQPASPPAPATDTPEVIEDREVPVPDEPPLAPEGTTQAPGMTGTESGTTPGTELPPLVVHGP